MCYINLYKHVCGYHTKRWVNPEPYEVFKDRYYMYENMIKLTAPNPHTKIKKENIILRIVKILIVNPDKRLTAIEKVINLSSNIATDQNDANVIIEYNVIELLSNHNKFLKSKKWVNDNGESKVGIESVSLSDIKIKVIEIAKV